MSSVLKKADNLNLSLSLGIAWFFLTLEIHYIEKKLWLFEKKFLAVIYVKYFLLQFNRCLSWVYTYFHVVIERIATLHKKNHIFIRNTA